MDVTPRMAWARFFWSPVSVRRCWLVSYGFLGLVLVLVLGMIIGSDGLSLIELLDGGRGRTSSAQSVVIIALVLILYEGGGSSGWRDEAGHPRVLVLLATVGTLITAGLTAIAAPFLFTDLSNLEALMLGSTVVATDAAAVFAGGAARVDARRWIAARCRASRALIIRRRAARAGLHRGGQARRLRAATVRAAGRGGSSRSARRSGWRSAISDGRRCGS